MNESFLTTIETEENINEKYNRYGKKDFDWSK